MNNIYVDLKSEIYPLFIIKKAVSDYSQIAEITVKTMDNSTLCFFKDGQFSADLVKNEFCNYLIEILSSKVES